MEMEMWRWGGIRCEDGGFVVEVSGEEEVSFFLVRGGYVFFFYFSFLLLLAGYEFELSLSLKRAESRGVRPTYC